MQLRKGKSIPEGWAVDTSGNPITDPKEAITSGLLLPLGGPEETSGYKGTGLAMMVEIFCGLLGGTEAGGTTVEASLLFFCFKVRTMVRTFQNGDPQTRKRIWVSALWQLIRGVSHQVLKIGCKICCILSGISNL